MSDQKTEMIGLQEAINFDCNPGLECYTTCCADVTIFLNPYDVLRLSEHLEMESTDFLKKYTMALQGSKPIIPLVVLKMNEDNDKKCFFVGSEGCSVHGVRPWACRMFPLDVTGNMDFKYLDGVQEICKGIGRGKEWTVKDYLDNQDVESSIEMDRLYNEITNHPNVESMDVDNPKVAQMVYLALYDLDLFRRLIFESSFLDKFIIDDQRIAAIKDNKIELYKFGLDWVKFGLFGEKTLIVKSDDDGQA